MSEIFFFIGTEAELIKVFPVMLELKRRGRKYHIIASGQNDITKSVIFQKTDCGNVDLKLSDEKDIKKSAAGLLSWWIKTYRSAASIIRKEFPEAVNSNSYMIVHGDTVSTYMGARIGRSLGMTVCHVEAGLRSHNIFNPFPEEIDRKLTSSIARLHFAPGEQALSNLQAVKGKAVSTGQNTLLDSLKVSEQIAACEEISHILSEEKPYFVFVMHRQENVANEKLFRAAVMNALQISSEYKCVFILHSITRNALERLGLMDKVENSPNVILLSRVDYFSFMKLLKGSEFVITDGGSNQEELFYMGKPTLIMRKTTERNEGLGENAKLYSDVDEIISFAHEYRNYIRHTDLSGTPSSVIADCLE
ncbi:MAG: UDP-N-acetylglucosamine 2-epimerase [Butyrivibrio sp.]|uniref:UDP-N-acetylglucosamine 2-epimerase n=1 Tax=Butyrivibrio sp. TaxID=28121 RepID=UPI0025B9FC22|nr:UDP-N-acetylglucosamine 2-epimerase [Butyrivibrio sp.]MBQ6587224.1 UDP-N-acetylglucosamine 2-epimerase [Butyrivibrio sp.]